MKTTTTKPEVVKEPDEISRQLESIIFSIAGTKKPTRLRYLKEIFEAAAKLARESPGTLNIKIAATVLKELRYSFKLFYPHRFTPKITVFGSARTEPDHALCDFARQFGAEAVKRKFMIITGGGPGIMAAANEGAGVDGGFGLNIRLPHEQAANPFIDQKKGLINYKYFFTRKLFLVKEASAFVLFPGGFGTLDETFELLTLVQTGKTNMIPIVFLEPKGNGYWEHLMGALERQLLKDGFISKADTSLYHVSHDVSDALNHIEFFYKNYHSMRYVKERLVIRFRYPLLRKTLDEINKKFGKLSKNGKIESSPPLEEEANEEELKHLHRIVFPFARRDFGTLRLLVDFLNQSVP